MIKKVITALSIIFNLAQIGFIIYFLSLNTTDDMPLFIFLFVAPLASILAIFLNRKV